MTDPDARPEGVEVRCYCGRGCAPGECAWVTIPASELARQRALEAENETLRTALHDSVRSPLGVVPDSAAPYYHPESREAPDAWLRDSRLCGRVAREVADAAGLRPDDPPLREHLDAAREIIRLVRTAPAALQGERERVTEIVSALADLVRMESVSFPGRERDYLDRESVVRIAFRIKRAALRSTELGGEHGE